MVIAGVVALPACNDVEVLPFPAGQGQKKMAATYPSGPYGTTKGTVINDYAFIGFYAPQTGADPTAPKPITLGDFYNPTGTDMYPAGSPYGEGTPKPKALLIDIGAGWCGPCKHEAQTTLPAAYPNLQSNGAQFLFIMADGVTPGVTATSTDLLHWVTAFKTTWPSAIDPQRLFVSQFGVGTTSYPVNIIVDTRTMLVVDVLPGEATPDFLNELTTVLGK